MNSKQQEAQEVIKLATKPNPTWREKQVIINWALKTAKELVQPDR